MYSASCRNSEAGEDQRHDADERGVVDQEERAGEIPKFASSTFQVSSNQRLARAASASAGGSSPCCDEQSRLYGLTAEDEVVQQQPNSSVECQPSYAANFTATDTPAFAHKPTR